MVPHFKEFQANVWRAEKSISQYAAAAFSPIDCPSWYNQPSIDFFFFVLTLSLSLSLFLILEHHPKIYQYEQHLWGKYQQVPSCFSINSRAAGLRQWGYSWEPQHWGCICASSENVSLPKDVWMLESLVSLCLTA